MGKIFPKGEKLGYSSDVVRDQQFPLKKINKENLEKRLSDQKDMIGSFEQRIREGQLNHKTHQEIVGTALKINSIVAKNLKNYFTELFAEELDGWYSLGISDFAWMAMDVLEFDSLFNINGKSEFKIQGEMKSLHHENDKLFWYGSFNDFEKMTKKTLHAVSPPEEEDSASLKNFKHLTYTRVMDQSRTNTWYGCLPLLTAVSALPAAGLSYWADWDYGWIVPGLFAADMLIRRAGSKITGRAGAPGILGFAKTIGEYVSVLFKRDTNVA